MTSKKFNAMWEDTAQAEVAAKPILSFHQSIRVAILSVFFALSITMMAHKHGKVRLATSLQALSPFDKETEYRMRKLLSEPSDLDDDDNSNIEIPLKESRPVNDAEVIAVENALRQSINEERRLNCASFKVHNNPGRVRFAERSFGKGGRVRYDMEVTFDDETVFARISKGKGAAKTSFQIDSRIPAPCEDGVNESIAVSFAGQSTNMLQSML